MLFGTYEGEESIHLPPEVLTEVTAARGEHSELRNHYQINQLHVSTNPIVLSRGGGHDTRYLHRKDMTTSDDVTVDLLLLSGERDAGKEANL